MKVSIKEVTTKKELKQFIKFPNKLYKRNQFYVPPLIAAELSTLSKDKNPAFEFCDAKYWLAYQDDEIVGRIAGIINHTYNELKNTVYARFGWIDFIDDKDVVNALFDTVEAWAQQNKATYIHGPLGFFDFDLSGVLVEGFDEIPTSFGKYNHRYYATFIENRGYEKEVDWVEYNIKVPSVVPQRYITTGESIKKRYDLHTLKMTSMKKVLQYADQIFELVNRQYASLHGFSELSKNQIEDLKKQFVPLLQLKYVCVVLNADDKVVGFGICLPSLSKALQKAKGRMYPFGMLWILRALKKNDTIDTLLIAVDSVYKDKGVNAIIFSEIGSAMVKNGITNVETTRMLEDNINIQNLFNKLEYRQHKRARCYIKKLPE